MDRGQRETVKRVAGAIITALFVATIVLFVAVAALPRLFGAELRNVVSGSMEPAIEKGSLVVSFPAEFEELRAGDVILFRTPDSDRRIVTHRVVGVEDEAAGRTLLTRGDANQSRDPWELREGDVLGKVELDVPKLGYVVERIRSREGFILLMVVPGTVILLGELPLWYRTLTRRRRPEAEPGVVGALPTAASRAPSPVLSAVAVLAVSVIAATAVTYALAPRPDSNDEEDRTIAEAQSIATHSQRLADGDAFLGDIEILRDATDPRLIDPATAPEDRLTALRQMLLLNTNRFDMLALVGLDGTVLHATDETFAAGASVAFTLARDEGGVAAAFATEPPLADYAAPVRDAAGTTVSIIVGRTTPTRQWTTSLATTIDGSVNAIVDRDGVVVGAPQTVELGTTIGVEGDTMRARIGAGDFFCSPSAIGSGTHLDAGLRIVSCLPTSLAASESISYRQYLIDSIGLALVVTTIGALAMVVLLRERKRQQETGEMGLRAIEARLREMGR